MEAPLPAPRARRQGRRRGPAGLRPAAACLERRSLSQRFWRPGGGYLPQAPCRKGRRIEWTRVGTGNQSREAWDALDGAQRIGPFVVERELARGGMGVVYIARHVALDRRVALKLMSIEGDAVATERFAREAEALARVEHPAVVRVHEVGEHQGKPYLAMDLVDGESLQDRIDREGPLPADEAIPLIRPLAEALAHQAQIIVCLPGVRLRVQEQSLRLGICDKLLNEL